MALQGLLIYLNLFQSFLVLSCFLSLVNVWQVYPTDNLLTVRRCYPSPENLSFKHSFQLDFLPSPSRGEGKFVKLIVSTTEVDLLYYIKLVATLMSTDNVIFSFWLLFLLSKEKVTMRCPIFRKYRPNEQ